MWCCIITRTNCITEEKTHSGGCGQYRTFWGTKIFIQLKPYSRDGQSFKHHLFFSASLIANCSLFCIVAFRGFYHHGCNYEPRSSIHRNEEGILYTPESFDAHSPSKQLQSNCPGAVTALITSYEAHSRASETGCRYLLFPVQSEDDCQRG